MTKQLSHKFNLTFGLITTSLISLNCFAEVTQPASASQKPITYKSSLSEFKSINNDKDKLSANDAAEDMKGMDHSKMDADEMKDMKGMDHSKMSADEMKDMKGMDHSKMSADEMKDMKGMDHSKMSADELKGMEAAPKKSAKPAKVKKLKSIKKSAKPVSPAKADLHQNHQM